MSVIGIQTPGYHLLTWGTVAIVLYRMLDKSHLREEVWSGLGDMLRGCNPVTRERHDKEVQSSGVGTWVEAVHITTNGNNSEQSSINSGRNQTFSEQKEVVGWRLDLSIRTGNRKEL